LKSKLRIILLGTAILLTTQGNALASDLQQVKVDLNLVKINVNDIFIKTNTILYEGTVYISIRDVASTLKLPANYHQKNQTVYIGQLGEISNADPEVKTWDVVTPALPSNDPISPQKVDTINVNLNEVKVKVNGKALSADTIFYNGTSYVSMRAVAESLGLPVEYDQNSSIAYIGNHKAVVPTAAEVKSKLYDVPADGKMKGWQVLKGHEYEADIKIYFQTIGKEGYSLQIEDVREYDPNQIIEWTDTKGVVKHNKVSDIYEVFKDYNRNPLLRKYLKDTFGDLYLNWLSVRAIPADQLLERYLRESGQLNTVKNNVTLTPDAVIQIEPKKEPKSDADAIRKRINSSLVDEIEPTSGNNPFVYD
jgi:hypothetical protein